MSKHTLFDWLNQLTQGGNLTLTEDNQVDYPIFMVNRGLSQHADLIFIVNEANRVSITDKERHFDFMNHSINKKKRYGKWSKSDNDETLIALVRETYNYSYDKAVETLSVLTKQQLDTLQETMTKPKQ